MTGMLGVRRLSVSGKKSARSYLGTTDVPVARSYRQRAGVADVEWEAEQWGAG